MKCPLIIQSGSSRPNEARPEYATWALNKNSGNQRVESEASDRIAATVGTPDSQPRLLYSRSQFRYQCVIGRAETTRQGASLAINSAGFLPSPACASGPRSLPASPMGNENRGSGLRAGSRIFRAPTSRARARHRGRLQCARTVRRGKCRRISRVAH